MTIREAVETLKHNSSLVYISVQERVWCDEHFPSTKNSSFSCDYSVRGKGRAFVAATTLSKLIKEVEYKIGIKTGV